MNNSPMAACHKPRKIVVPLSEALAWRGGCGFIYQEKMDGCFSTLAIAGNTILGERMAAGRFVAFDCLARQGQDISQEPTRIRWAELNAWFQELKKPASPAGDYSMNHGGRLPLQDVKIELCPSGNGGEFLEAVLARGGEGIVAKHLDAPYGEMLAAKRIWEGLCVVSGFNGGTNSVIIADATTGQPRGKVTCPGFKIEKIRVGSILKVQGMNLTERGMVREPRLCRDTPTSWLVKY